MTQAGAIEAMGISSESGAMLLVRSVGRDGMAKIIMIDATLSEFDDLEERALEVRDIWILSPTPAADVPIQLLPVDEVLQPYHRDGERRDEVLLRCETGAWFRLSGEKIEPQGPTYQCWKRGGRVRRRELPILIEG